MIPSCEKICCNGDISVAGCVRCVHLCVMGCGEDRKQLVWLERKKGLQEAGMVMGGWCCKGCGGVGRWEEDSA